MPLDGISAKCLAHELSSRLCDSRVDRIYQPDRFDILFVMRRGHETLRLIVSANPAAPRLHLTTETRDNPAQPPMFCMLLRKYLIGARLLSVEIPGYERIFILRFQTQNELGDTLEKRLIVEIMGRHSNIIFVNQENRIHDAIAHVDESISRVREIMPARPYVLPPSQSKLTPREVLDRLQPAPEALEGNDPGTPAPLDFLNPNLPLAKALLETMQGFSPQLCQEVCYQAGLDPRLRSTQLDKTQVKRLQFALTAILSTIEARSFVPTVFYVQTADAVPVDFHSLPLTSLAHGRPSHTLSEAMDLYYLERNRQNTLQQKKQSLGKIVANELEHARKKLLIHQADRLEGENREQYRRFGELIIGQLNRITDGQARLHTVDYFVDTMPAVDIALQPDLTPAQNAQRYFRLYQKARSKYETGSRLAREDQQEIEWLESVQSELEKAIDLQDIRAVREELASAGLISAEGDIRRPARNRGYRNLGDSSGTDNQGRPDGTGFSGGTAGPGRSGTGSPGNPRSHPADFLPGKPGKRSKRSKQALAGKSARGGAAGKQKGSAQPAALPPRRYQSSDGLTIMAGRNNLQNDQLTLKTAQKDDIWLHVQKMPGTHVIIRCGKQEVPVRTLEEAAAIAAWFSRATSASLPGGVMAPKVAVDYCPVSHVRKPPGSRPGHVIYERYQTIMARPQDPRAWPALPDQAGSSPEN